jgi:hypothetical protein
MLWLPQVLTDYMPAAVQWQAVLCGSNGGGMAGLCGREAPAVTNVAVQLCWKL